MIKKFMLITGLFLSCVVYANDDSGIGMDMDGKYQRQNYAQDSSTHYRLSLQPWWSYANWLVYGELPFEARDSTVISQQTIYARTSTGRIIRRITPQSVTTTKKQQQEGIADAVLGLSYGYFIKDWQLATALDYKFDNGDAVAALGSDTTETSMSWSSTYSVQQVKLKGQIGYVFIGGNNPYQNKDYNFVSASAKWQLQPRVDLTLLYSTQSEPYANAPAQDYVQSRVDWRVDDVFKIYASFGLYLQKDVSLPEQEFNVGLKIFLN